MQVLLTKTAIQCLQDIKSFKLINSESEQVASLIKLFIETNVNKLSLKPKMHPFSTQALDYGLKIQERVDQNYRVLFEINEGVVFILLVLHTKQDIVKALFRHQIIRGFN